jgi:protocatechuate 3,4-dioxygenase beta subunit
MMTRSDPSRRAALGFGLGAALLAACGRGRAAGVDARPALAPTPHIDDGDDDLAAAAACDPTADNIEGPFYKSGAPSRAVLASDRDRGEPLALSGRVMSTGCAPLGDTTLEVWHADHRGDYDLDAYRFRAQLRSDADGRWAVRTIIPGRYLNGRRYRPAHLHFKLHAAGHRPLTTQLYFDGDPYNDGDPFIVSSLIMPHRRRDGITRARFDFILASTQGG